MPERQDESTLRTWEFFCLASLLVLVLVLVQRGWGLACLVPLLIGLGGIAGRWWMAPALLLGALTLMLTGLFTALRSALVNEPALQFDEADVLTDVLLAVAVLSYVTGQVRLRGLADGLFPADPRVPKGQVAPVERGEPGWEMALLVLSLAFAAVGARFAWELLPDRGYGLGFTAGGWRLLVLAWLLALGGLVGAGLAAYIHRKHRTAAEAALFLQDVFWRETRGEQRRLYRWAAWRRRRARRRKGDS